MRAWVGGCSCMYILYILLYLPSIAPIIYCYMLFLDNDSGASCRMAQGGCVYNNSRNLGIHDTSKEGHLGGGYRGCMFSLSSFIAI